MVKILTSRGAGRSYDIARYAIANKCNILVPHYNSIKYMRTVLKKIFEEDGYVIMEEFDSGLNYGCVFRRNYESELQTIKVFSAYDALQRRGFADGENVVIDDAEYVLKQIFNQYNVKGMTMCLGE